MTWEDERKYETAGNLVYSKCGFSDNSSYTCYRFHNDFRLCVWIPSYPLLGVLALCSFCIGNHIYFIALYTCGITCMVIIEAQTICILTERKMIQENCMSC